MSSFNRSQLTVQEKKSQFDAIEEHKRFWTLPHVVLHNLFFPRLAFSTVPNEKIKHNANTVQPNVRDPKQDIIARKIKH